jgi:NAD(P)H-flavin reductase
MQDKRFNYQMLSRLQQDCEYYLGYGYRCKKHLYYKDEQEHIDEMKKLYNSFSDDEKPEWLTWEEIEAYEKQMIGL